MLRRHGEYALELGWERNNFYVWTKQKGVHWCMVQSVGKGKYSATINGVRLHPLRMFFEEAINACEEQPQPKPVTEKVYGVSSEIADAIKKVLSERYADDEVIDGILSSGTLEEVLVSFYYYARQE